MNSRTGPGQKTGAASGLTSCMKSISRLMAPKTPHPGWPWEEPFANNGRCTSDALTRPPNPNPLTNLPTCQHNRRPGQQIMPINSIRFVVTRGHFFNDFYDRVQYWSSNYLPPYKVEVKIVRECVHALANLPPRTVDPVG